MKKRITNKEYKAIGRNIVADWAMPMCNFTLEETEGGNYEVITEMKMIPYLLLFIPVHFVQMLQCIWDGGLITFKISSRRFGRVHFSWGSECWKKAEEIMKNGVDKQPTPCYNKDR